MKAARYHGLRDVRVEDVPEPTILKGSDALVRVTKAGICGSDLHFFNNGPDLGMEAGTRLGHEFVGVVEAVGADVTGLTAGDRVVAPFVFSDGSCFFCGEGIHSSCTSGGIFGSPFWGPHAGGEVEGGQSEFVRVPEADGTLVVIPEALAAAEHDAAVLPLGDVFATGYHGAVQTGIRPGDTVVVIGDGAVGLCAVQAAALKGAAHVVLLGHHADRVTIGMANGATHTADGDEAATSVVQELTEGRGADAVIDSISGDSSIKQAIGLVRDGGAVSMLGMSHFFQPVEQPISATFMRNVSLHPGVAPTRAYIPELLPEVERGTINPGVVFTHDLPLDDAPKGFEIMDSRAEGSIKVALTP
ncbi:MAG TPA: alcohol dehydrogenase catalytic domain-containing protein [Miltoncostaea sp.]|nr:alcohol dehydrogenase catalytic domain-containing protein [Miltoncostaea sp.]